jgi:hypothetical protein
VITNAPTGCSALLATAERFLFALGASTNGRLVKWSDQEDNTTWTAAATNQAGDFELNTVGALKCGKRVRGINLLFTDVDVHTATYVGLPYVYLGYWVQGSRKMDYKAGFQPMERLTRLGWARMAQPATGVEVA